MSQCTFKPNIEKPEINSTSRTDQVPGYYEYLRRWKVSNEKQQYLKHFYDNLGSKYTGMPTETRPFNLTVSRERLLQENKKREEEKAAEMKNASKQFQHTIISRAAKEKREQAALEQSKIAKQNQAEI